MHDCHVCCEPDLSTTVPPNTVHSNGKANLVLALPSRMEEDAYAAFTDEKFHLFVEKHQE